MAGKDTKKTQPVAVGQGYNYQQSINSSSRSVAIVCFFFAMLWGIGGLVGEGAGGGATLCGGGRRE